MGEWLVEAPVAGLVFARCGGMLAVLPPLNVRGFPVLLRLGIAALLTLALAPMAPVGPVEAAPAPGMYLALLVREAAVGALAGFAGALVFAGFMIAGQLLDALLQAGEQQTRAAGHGPVTGLTYLLAATLLVAADGHHWLLAALVEGMRVLPPGSGWALLEVAAGARSAGVTLWTGVAIAAPALAAIYAAELAISAFGRLAPGLGLGEAAPAVRWSSGFLGLVVTLPLLGHVVADQARMATEAIRAAFILLGE